MAVTGFVGATVEWRPVGVVQAAAVRRLIGVVQARVSSPRMAQAAGALRGLELIGVVVCAYALGVRACVLGVCAGVFCVRACILAVWGHIGLAKQSLVVRARSTALSIVMRHSSITRDDHDR